MGSCIMPGLPTHLEQELNVVTVEGSLYLLSKASLNERDLDYKPHFDFTSLDMNSIQTTIPGSP